LNAFLNIIIFLHFVENQELSFIKNRTWRSIFISNFISFSDNASYLWRI